MTAGTARSGHGPADWLSPDAALATILENIRPRGTEMLPAARALGRILREPVVSLVDHPAWDNSAMDGFAVHAEDVRGASEAAPVELPVVDSVPAGAFPSGPLASGTAVRVMTGAPVPDGTTGVVRIEHTRDHRDRIEILDDSDAERHIRRRGEDVSRGDMLLAAGEDLTPASIGLLAMSTIGEVVVGRRPRIAVLTNGDELAGPGDYSQVREGRRIANSNGPALVAQLEATGAEAVDLGIAPDDPRVIRQLIESAPDVDGWIAAAGVSVGEHDHVKQVLDESGWTRRFWRVSMRPGSATTFGTLDGRPFWGVPGNPVSAMVAYEILVRPAVRAMAGALRVERTSVPAVAGEPMRGAGSATSFLRVRVRYDGSRLVAHLSGEQGSAMLGSMRADALARIPEGTSRVESGDRVELIPLGPWFAQPDPIESAIAAVV